MKTPAWLLAGVSIKTKAPAPAMTKATAPGEDHAGIWSSSTRQSGYSIEHGHDQGNGHGQGIAHGQADDHGHDHGTGAGQRIEHDQADNTGRRSRRQLAPAFGCSTGWGQHNDTITITQSDGITGIDKSSAPSPREI
jgi:hypothetical protein